MQPGLRWHNLYWLWIALVVLLADQASKIAADLLLSYAQPVAVLPFFNLTLLYNPGAAFSFLADAGGWQRWFFFTLAVVISVVLAEWLLKLPQQARRHQWGISLVIGGAIGNAIDRIAYGHVVDFFDFHLAGYHWPAFNIADAAITIGVALLLWAELTRTDHQGTNT